MGICFSLDQRASSTFHTSCLRRLREIRWWRIRWRSRALAVLVLLSSRFVSFRRQGTLLWTRMKKYFYSKVYFWVPVFVWSFRFFVLGSTSLPLSFSRDSLGRVPCANLPLVFVGPHEGRASNFIFRMDLLPLSIFSCISCIIVSHW